MFADQASSEKKNRQKKWASTSGDHVVLSAKESKGPGKYIGDLNSEMSESVRVKPVRSGEKLKSVKPSCCAVQKELPELEGQIQLSTGKAEIGYDPKMKDMVFSFIRHENDSEGKEVLENKASTKSVYDGESFRSNDGNFAQGAMELRSKVSKAPKKVLRQFGKVSGSEGDTTLDRVIPFHRRNKESAKVQSLLALEHSSDKDRSNIHSAVTGARLLAAKKQQKNVEFNKKLFRAIDLAKENTHTSDYMLYIKKKWELMRQQALEENPEFAEQLNTDFIPEEPVKDNLQVENIK